MFMIASGLFIFSEDAKKNIRIFPLIRLKVGRSNVGGCSAAGEWCYSRRNSRVGFGCLADSLTASRHHWCSWTAWLLQCTWPCGRCRGLSPPRCDAWWCFELSIHRDPVMVVWLNKMQYHNGYLFHKLKKDFLLQSGDPTGTGCRCKSVYKFLYGDQAQL